MAFKTVYCLSPLFLAMSMPWTAWMSEDVYATRVTALVTNIGHGFAIGSEDGERLFLSEQSLTAMLITCLDVVARVVRDCLLSPLQLSLVLCSAKNKAGRKLLQRQRSSWNTGDISHSPLAWRTIKRLSHQRASHQRAAHVAGLLSSL